jgi:hypothetical protein
MISFFRLFVAFALGVVALSALLLFSAELPKDFYEYKLFDLLQFFWTAGASVAIAYFLSKSVSTKARIAELLVDILDGAIEHSKAIVEAAEAFENSPTQDNFQRLLRRSKQLRVSLDHFYKLRNRCPGVKRDALDVHVEKVRGALKKYFRTVTNFDSSTSANRGFYSKSTQVAAEFDLSVIDLKAEIFICYA